MKLAKITKIDFNLANLMHTALVSIRGDENESFIHVQLLQSFFKKVFGVEHIRYKYQNGKIALEEVTYPFMRDIASVVNKNLNMLLSQSRGSSLWVIKD
ncbi:MAG: hypothetical protein ACXWCZ_05135 [Flavisolibacter sp.]